jgi:predicted transcriptional regulator of viral defense system
LTVIGEAKRSIETAELRRQSASSLLSLLEASNILQPLALVEAKPSTALYAVGPFNADTLDPVDLLMAAQPGGVVCYFSALQHYELTTQNPSHHHVAKLGTKAPSPVRVRQDSSYPTSGGKGGSVRSPLGTHLFSFQSIPYYQTIRAAHTIAGIQKRQVSERTIARITTREQTLIDALNRPLSCGGAGVVWEAWTAGLGDIDEDRFVATLVKLDNAQLIRRVGYMVQELEYRPQAGLATLLNQSRLTLGRDPDIETVPLLPGLPIVRVDSVWRLQLPGR